MINNTSATITPEAPSTRAIQCPDCHNIFHIQLAHNGKDIHFLNLITWHCPRCKHQNVTPFLEGEAS